MKKILVMGLIMIMGLIFIPQKNVKAAGMEENTIQYTQDIPTDITNPVEKGKSLVVYFMQAIGWFAAALGFVFLGIAFFGHQPDQKINALISFAVAILLIVGPSILDWLIS